MATPLKASVGLSSLITKWAAGAGEPIIWEHSVGERGWGGGGIEIRVGQRGRIGRGEKARMRGEGVGNKREGITTLTTKESKEKTRQTNPGAFWQHSLG